MTVSTLLSYLESNPDRWDAPLYLISESSEGYAKSSIRKVELDQYDSDLNFIVEDQASDTIVLNQIRAVLEAPEHQGHPVYSRRIFTPPLTVKGEAFTHLDNPIEGVSESNTGAIGLFEKFEGKRANKRMKKANKSAHPTAISRLVEFGLPARRRMA